jgi:hypothetical protein
MDHRKDFQWLVMEKLGKKPVRPSKGCAKFHLREGE